MNKKRSKKFKRIIFPAITFLVIAAALFVLTSCTGSCCGGFGGRAGNSSGQSEESVAAEAATETTAAGTESTSANKTTSGGTETTAAAQTTKPQDQQIIEVTANSRGYSPRKIEAKAGVPTILVMKSDGAYGCERSFNIPSLNVSEILPENGETRFDLGTQDAGTKIVGVCSMGMYSFQIIFN